jgi:succinyl-diaminopimelate desuccinylase
MNPTQSHELLRQALAIATVNGENREYLLAEFLRNYFAKFGIRASVDDGNIYARIEGKESGRVVVLNGHLDTVPYGDVSLWKTNPAIPEEKDGKIYARGASDMKSGLCAIVSALCELKQTGVQPRRAMAFLGTADEEKGGTGALRAVKNGLCASAELLLIGEPTDCRVGVAQKGCLWLKCSVKGRTSHGAYPWEGANAAVAGFTFVTDLEKFVAHFTHPLLGASTLSLNMVQGGVAFNMVPDSCEFCVDIRMVPPLTTKSVLAQASIIAEEIRSRNKDISIGFEIVNDRCAIKIASDNPDLSLLHSCIRKIRNAEQSDIGINFYTDASIFVKNNPELPVLLFGPGKPDMAHKPDEFVDWEMYDSAVRIYGEFIR